MTAETSTALLIGAASAAGTAAVQSSTLGGVPIALISGVVGVAVSWGMMRVTVKTVERDVASMHQDIRDIYMLTRDISDRVSKMEGRAEK
jgi:broad specificity polyphosphatase/5'/3'-nucleotidase SurE